MLHVEKREGLAWYTKSREERHEHMINNERGRTKPRANKKLEVPVSHKKTSNNGKEV